jgi:hypothetical protein
MTRVLIASYVDQHTACSSDELYGPSKIVKVASLSEGRGHVAVLIVVCGLPREVDEASVDAELLLNSCCMLLCCTSLVGILPQTPGSMRKEVAYQGTCRVGPQPRDAASTGWPRNPTGQPNLSDREPP